MLSNNILEIIAISKLILIVNNNLNVFQTLHSSWITSEKILLK